IDFSSSPHGMNVVSEALHSVEEETGLKVIIGIFDDENFSYANPKENHIVTLLGKDRPGIIAGVSNLFHQKKVNIEHCTMIARGEFFSMEMGIDTGAIPIAPESTHVEAVENLKAELKNLCRELNQSIVIQSEDVYVRRKKLVVFDVESSLISASSLKSYLEKVEGEVAAAVGSVNWENGKPTHIQQLIENAQRLAGITMSALQKFSDILDLNPGAMDLIRILKSMGFKIALLSSGFSFLTKEIFEGAGVDYAFSNTLKCDPNGIITGELEDPIITSESKTEILRFIMNLEKIGPDQVIAVGDGSTHSHFIKNVGLSIAVRPHAQEMDTDGILSGDHILKILYCLGLPKAELEKYVK
ncbi:MAG TPA: HAD-IB family phosphatase, partial [Desulfobacteria bacterium]|nr:HAD-IB family phosphatase [Desulfobacteria bacterium]